MQKLALISVSDKTGLTELASGLINNNYKILATGNTSKRISEAGIEVTEIAELTGFPEIMDGRVKTLHPKIFGGILLRRDNEVDQKEAKENQISPIDIVCVNLYPFINVTSKEDVDLDTAVENIDIGGISLIRAAAKNHKFVSVLTSPYQYEKFLEELSKGGITEETKRKLAVAAFAHTSEYDTYIANYFESRFKLEPKNIRINLPLDQNLRYGENPHQKAGIYGKFSDHFELLHGKELSYNNIFDLVSAVELVEELGENSCTIIKHSNPAGAATGKDFFDAYEKALKCDPVSAFG
ncbi:MAG: bifunctional phosphoribosylaminoimidazolecarboxamide formyltransferase/IMP cyclohydrolase, partial [Ignavibacteriaceae bacterium]